MASAALLAVAVAAAWSLSRRGLVIQVAWATLNVLDTLRALRVVRPNGRRVGAATRARAMRDALVCWVVYVAVHAAGPVVDGLLSWLPLYAPLKATVALGFLALRIPASGALYTALVRPCLARYETPIDLCLLLVHALATLIAHYALLPLRLAVAAVGALVWRRRLPALQTHDGGSVDVDALEDEHADDARAAVRPASPAARPAPARPVTPLARRAARPRTPPPRADTLAPPAVEFDLRRSPRRRNAPGDASGSSRAPSPDAARARLPRRAGPPARDVNRDDAARFPAAPTALVSVPLLDLPAAPTHDPASAPGPSAPRPPAPPVARPRATASRAQPPAQGGSGSSRPSSRAPSVRSANVPRPADAGAARGADKPGAKPAAAGAGGHVKAPAKRPAVASAAAPPATSTSDARTARPVKGVARARAAAAAAQRPAAAPAPVPLPVTSGEARDGAPRVARRPPATPGRAKRRATPRRPPGDDGESEDAPVYLGVGRKRGTPARPAKAAAAAADAADAGAEPRAKRARTARVDGTA